MHIYIHAIPHYRIDAFSGGEPLCFNFPKGLLHIGGPLDSPSPNLAVLSCKRERGKFSGVRLCGRARTEETERRLLLLGDSAGTNLRLCKSRLFVEKLPGCVSADGEGRGLGMGLSSKGVSVGRTGLNAPFCGTRRLFPFTVEDKFLSSNASFG